MQNPKRIPMRKGINFCVTVMLALLVWVGQIGSHQAVAACNPTVYNNLLIQTQNNFKTSSAAAGAAHPQPTQSSCSANILGGFKQLSSLFGGISGIVTGIINNIVNQACTAVTQPISSLNSLTTCTPAVGFYFNPSLGLGSTNFCSMIPGISDSNGLFGINANATNTGNTQTLDNIVFFKK